MKQLCEPVGEFNAYETTWLVERGWLKPRKRGGGYTAASVRKTLKCWRPYVGRLEPFVLPESNTNYRRSPWSDLLYPVPRVRKADPVTE